MSHEFLHMPALKPDLKKTFMQPLWWQLRAKIRNIPTYQLLPVGTLDTNGLALTPVATYWTSSADMQIDIFKLKWVLRPAF